MRYTKLQRYFLQPYNTLERVLVALNYYMNFYIMVLFVNTPLLLRLAHEARRRDSRGGAATCARSCQQRAVVHSTTALTAARGAAHPPETPLVCVPATDAPPRVRAPAGVPPATYMHQILLGSAFPIHGAAKNVLGGALLLQLVYDWYWNTRLRRSWIRCARARARELLL